jgi:hypothetical protein
MVKFVTNYNYNPIPTHLIRKITSVTHNVISTIFLDKWPNGRLYKHGGMAITFRIRPSTRVSALPNSEKFMDSRGFTRTNHYHVPEWNFSPQRHATAVADEYISNPLIVTFATEEHFIMAKLAWDFGNED